MIFPSRNGRSVTPHDRARDSRRRDGDKHVVDYENEENA